MLEYRDAKFSPSTMLRYRTFPLYVKAVCVGKERGRVTRTTLGTTGPVPGELSAVNAIGTQLRALQDTGLTR